MKTYPEYHPPTDPWIDILHADETLIVLNKQAGLLSVPGNIARDSLETRVQAEFPDARIVHRLDMATSGVMVMARGKANLTHLQQQFEKRKTWKRYLAQVWGEVKGLAGTIDAPLRCDWPNRPLQMICHDRGRDALTHWRVEHRDQGTTRVSLTPVTGRSHQLRVHLKSIGHPILGDPWYAHAEARNAADRLMLHAEALCLTHPRSETKMTFVAPSPI
ncbi:MAG: RluA family pseudouridine synthase [Parvularcula sp.]